MLLISTVFPEPASPETRISLWSNGSSPTPPSSALFTASKIWFCALSCSSFSFWNGDALKIAEDVIASFDSNRSGSTRCSSCQTSSKSLSKCSKVK